MDNGNNQNYNGGVSNNMNYNNNMNVNGSNSGTGYVNTNNNVNNTNTNTNTNVNNVSNNKDGKNYQKKKRALLVVFMFLLLVFVCLMCYVFIYSKQHPPKRYLSPDEIEIKQMISRDYVTSGNTPIYVEHTNSTDYTVKRGEEELKLIVEDNKVKVDNGEEKIDVVLKLNDNDVNSDIKLICQRGEISLILTNDGKLYRPTDNTISNDNTINVGEILNNTPVSSLIEITNADNMYARTMEDNKIINVNTGKEYNGVIRELKCNGGIVYVYEDYSFGLEEGKVVANESNSAILINMIFENKLIDVYGNIYELDFVNKTVSTSKLGTMTKVGFSRDDNGIYTLGLESSTGVYTFKSEYYYTKF